MKDSKFLREGRKSWEKHRKERVRESADWRPNFEEEDFSKDDKSMSECNLRRAVFDEATLTGVDAKDVNLRGAKFRSSKLLAGCSLQGADLRRALFFESRLEDIDLCGADLTEAVFRGSEIKNVDFSGAIFGRTSFINCWFDNCKSLSETRHLSQSHISTDTFARSGEHIPTHFLKMCGVNPALKTILCSDDRGKQIEALQQLSSVSLRKCFISFSSIDREIVSMFATFLRATGADYWYDAERIKAGDDLGQNILNAIEDRDKTIVVLSRSSINSKWVKKEMKLAIKDYDSNIGNIVPIILERKESLLSYIKRQQNSGALDDAAADIFKKCLTCIHFIDFSRENRTPPGLQSLMEKLERTLKL